MLIRDYQQPLLTVEKFSSRGMVAGAEACGVKTAMREVGFIIQFSSRIFLSTSLVI